MAFRRRRNFRKKRTFRRRMFGGKRSAIRKGIRSYYRKRTASNVRRILSKTTELKRKFVAHVYESVDPAITGASTVFDIQPDISQGLTNSERIGSTIILKKIIIHGVIKVRNYVTLNNGNGPLLGRLMLLRHKRYNDWNNFGNAFTTNSEYADSLLDQGDGGMSYNGTVERHYMPINRLEYTLKKQKFFKLNYIRRDTTSETGSSYAITNPGYQVKHFSFTLKFGKNGKKIVYDTNGSTEGINFPYFMLLGYSNVEEDYTNLGDQIQIGYGYTAYYTDA